MSSNYKYSTFASFCKWYQLEEGIKTFICGGVSKVAGQNPEVSTGIEIETRRNPSKSVETCHRNPSKPIETHRNLSKSKGFDFCQNEIRVLPRNLRCKCKIFKTNSFKLKF